MARLTDARIALAKCLPPEQKERLKRALGRSRSGNLEWLATVYGTDKGTQHWKRDAGHGYTSLYQRHLKRFRRSRPITLLEIGIASGASLRMWSEYFPKGMIVGIDIDDRRVDAPRVQTFQGSQQDPPFLDSVIDRVGPPDVIIDDGSHVGEHIVASFTTLWPRLADGGLYVIEDMHTAYDPEFGGGPRGTEGTSIRLVADLLDELYEGDVAEVHVYPDIAFVSKAASKPR